MIVFGGNHAGAPVGDVWTLDLANGPTWEQLAVPMPSLMPRQSHAATYDPLHDRMLIFGGERPTYGYQDDTWELRLAGVPSWQKIFSTGPPANVGGTLIYDTVEDRVVLLGGDAVGPGQWGLMQDVWILPTGTQQWSMVGPYVALRYAASGGFNGRAPAIFDAARRRIVAYGGVDAMMIPSIDLSGPDLGFSWLLPRPWPRLWPSAIYDPKRERMIMSLGGTQDSPIDETWELPLNGKPAWSVLPTGGAYEREFQAAIHDPLGDRMIVFGGYGSNETWELPLADPTWNRLAPGGVVPLPASANPRSMIRGGTG